MRKQILSVVIGLILFSSISFAQTIFKDDCQDLKQWQFLDMKGDGKLQIVEDLSVPPGFGPKVIEMRGSNVLLFADKKRMTNGTYLVLWKDVDPNHFDSDGIVLFRADYPDDLTGIRNMKTNRRHYWFEQDFDAGTQIKYRDKNDKELILTERPGVGLIYDKSWNYTGWLWQKVKCDAEKICAKFWSVVEPEPEHWLLQTKHSAGSAGRFGIRAWSAHARIAYYEASASDISVVPPPTYLYANHTLCFENQPITFKLFTNFPEPLPDANVELTVLCGNKMLGVQTYRLSFKSGSQNTRIGLNRSDRQPKAEIPKFLAKNLPEEGRCEFRIKLASSEGKKIAEASRSIKFKSICKTRKRLAKVSRAQEKLAGEINNLKTRGESRRAKQLASETAKMMLSLARDRLANRDQNGALSAIQSAEDALKRATGFPTAYLDTPEFALKFVDVQLTSESWRKGSMDTVTVFWQISGKKPGKDFSATLSLVDEYNAVIASDESQLEIPRSSGTIFKQPFCLKIPADYPDHPDKPVNMPSVFTGNHYLTIRVHGHRKNDASKKEILLLDNPQQQAFFPVGKHYLLREVYVSSSNVQIEKIVRPRFKIFETGTIQVKLYNSHFYPEKVQCFFQVTTAAGTIIHEAVEKVKLRGRSSLLCKFPWEANYVGNLKFIIKIIQNNQLKTQSVRELKIAWPENIQIEICRGNHVEQKDDEYTVPLNLTIRQHTPMSVPAKLELRVFAGKNEYAHETRILRTKPGIEKWQLPVWPHWGYYMVNAKVTCDEKQFYFEKRLVATVVETDGMKIKVNGEPFIVKGVNVHSIYSQSKRLTDQAMKILKAHGFNILRGDYPPRWEVEMAHANNLAWMLLPEFSCAHTDSIYARYEAAAPGAIQAVARQYVLANCGSASVLFWNSCNEIDNRLDEFLINLYPVFKIYDPYQRPVNYANLYGQDNWRGQDIMGVNYYFGIGQRALSRMPIIEHSIQVAKEHAMPIIFTEYNSWWGPVERTGAEAVEILWNANLKKGMSGGMLYKMTDVQQRHPGLLDNQHKLIIRKEMSQALIRFHADAAVEIKERQGRQLTLNIRNKRDFFLRQITLEVTYRGINKTFQLGTDISPETSIATAMLLPPELENVSFSLNGTLAYETHFGLKNRIPVDLYVKGK